MKILALEFSSDERSVAVAVREHGSIRILGSASETGGRSTRAFALIERALAEARSERTEIQGIALGIGPGSYTGIRAAISVAQGWQLATGLLTYPVSSVLAVAALAQEEGIQGRITVGVDAQRGDFYLASYEIGSRGILEADPLKLYLSNEIAQRLQGEQIILGPDAGGFAGAKELRPKADQIAKLAFTISPVPAEQLEPIYLRQTTFVKAPPGRIIPTGAPTEL